MIRTLTRIACISVSLIIINACTAPGKLPDGDDQSTLAMATQTLRDSGIRANPAVESLMQQADALIEDNSLELAEDKIERALRIAPDYAPGWSRLSQIALLKNEPARAVQMATRSNSHATDATNLKQLNWQLIRDARRALNDSAGVAQAEAAMRRLH